MNHQRILAAIDDEIGRLQQVRKLLQGSGGKLAALSASGKAPVRRVLSPEARERIAAAQKRRWAKHKKAAAAK